MLVYAKLPNSRSRRSLIDFVGRHVDPIKSLRKVTVTFFFAPHALAQERQHGALFLFFVSLRLAALQPPSKSYANRTIFSFFIQLSRNRGN